MLEAVSGADPDSNKPCGFIAGIRDKNAEIGDKKRAAAAKQSVALRFPLGHFSPVATAWHVYPVCVCEDVSRSADHLRLC